MALIQPDCLTNSGKGRLQDLKIWICRHHIQQFRLQAGQHIPLPGLKRGDGLSHRRLALIAGRGEIFLQPQIIRAAPIQHGFHIRPVHLLIPAQPAPLTGQEIGVNLDIGQAELDHGRAFRLYRYIADIPDIACSRISQQSGPGKGDQLTSHANAAGNFTRHIRRQPVWLAIFIFPGDQQKIAHIDRRPQMPVRGQTRQNILIHELLISFNHGVAGRPAVLK